MNSFGNGVKRVAVGAAVFAALGTAQAQSPVPVPCRELVGFATTPPGAIGPTTTPLTGAWGVVAASNGQFFSNKLVSSSCSVKVVSTDGKGKPEQTEFLVPAGTGVIMRVDECSMYKYLSSVDSKLSQGKTGEALTVISSMIAKVNTMQIMEPRREDIRDAAVDVQLCIAALP